LEQVAATAGGGAVAGGVAGYAAKKLVKLAAVVIALEVGLLAVLERKEILAVQWDALDGLVAGLGTHLEPGLLGAMSVVAALPIGAGLAGGFLAGFKVARVVCRSNEYEDEVCEVGSIGLPDLLSAFFAECPPVGEGSDAKHVGCLRAAFFARAPSSAEVECPIRIGHGRYFSVSFRSVESLSGG